MTTEVADWLDGDCFSIEFNFVRFNDLLNDSTNVAQTNINSSSLRRKSCGIKKRKEKEITFTPAKVASFDAASKLSYLGSHDMVKALSMSLPAKTMRIKNNNNNETTSNMCSDINFENVSFLKDGGITNIWSPMCSDVVC